MRKYKQKLNKTSEGVYEEVHSFTRKLTCQTNKDIDLIHDFALPVGQNLQFLTKVQNANTVEVFLTLEKQIGYSVKLLKWSSGNHMNLKENQI